MAMRRHLLKKDQCQKSLQWVYGGSIVPPLCLRCDSNTQKGKHQRQNGDTMELPTISWHSNSARPMLS